jgi:hypothetical protein
MIKKILREQILLLEITGAAISYINQEEIVEILKGYFDAALWTEEERLKDEHEQNSDYNDSDWDDDNDDDEIEKLINLRKKLENNSFNQFVAENIDTNSKIQAYKDIKTFILNAGESAVKEAINENGYAQMGHDIWLTRNGHGAGFLDRNYDLGQDLYKAAKQIGEVHLYITDSGELAFSNA